MISTTQAYLHHEIHTVDPSRDWLLFIHGAGGSIRTWKYQIEAFKKDFNLLIVDLRDHGDSQKLAEPFMGKYTFEVMARDIFHLMDALGIFQVHVMAVSMGSIVARSMEDLDPERIHSMVLPGAVLKLSPWIKIGLSVGSLFARWIPFWILARVLSFILMPRKNHQKARRIFLREADRIDPKAFHKWLAMTRKLGRELDKSFQRPPAVPTLAVMGAQDHAFLPTAKAFQEMHPSTSLRIIPHTGHVCNIEAWQEFNPLALAFLKRHSKPAKAKFKPSPAAMLTSI